MTTGLCGHRYGIRERHQYDHHLPGIHVMPEIRETNVIVLILACILCLKRWSLAECLPLRHWLMNIAERPRPLTALTVRSKTTDPNGCPRRQSRPRKSLQLTPHALHSSIKPSMVDTNHQGPTVTVAASETHA
jgi:hypothetical protein